MNALGYSRNPFATGHSKGDHVRKHVTNRRHLGSSIRDLGVGCSKDVGQDLRLNGYLGWPHAAEYLMLSDTAAEVNSMIRHDSGKGTCWS